MNRLYVRDERETAIDRAGDRIAYLVLTYGLLAVVAYRSFVGGQASWDLLGLVVLGGAAGTAYRLWHRVLTREAVALVGVSVLVAVVVAILIALSPG